MKLGIYGDRTPPLGRLERDVLELLWTKDFQTALELLAALSARRAITLSTVQTTLERLTRKRLLAREKDGRGYRYRAQVRRDELLARMVSDLVGALSPSGPGLSVASLLDFDDDVDEETLQRLERWLDARRRQPGEPQ